MKRVTTILVAMALLISLSLSVQADFVRTAVIEADSLDIGGYGNLISGMDLDGDGRAEMYAINTDWHDVIGFDLIPRIYKYELNDAGDWETVWSTEFPLDFQNTWGALTYGDIDGDGKGEIIWGIVNNFGSGLQPNPERIAIYETVGDGSDAMGIDNGDGTYGPNTSWTISTGVEENIRPFRWELYDLDGDGALEILAACRAGDGMQIYSVDDVPDGGPALETWALEFTGVAATFYDMEVLNGTFYGISSGGDVYSVKWDGSAYVASAGQIGGAALGSWKSAQTTDVDGDGTDEILMASWSSSASAVYLLQESGDSLASYMIKDIPDDANRLYGGAVGDVDDNGNVDFVFGTRQATTNALIVRVEYLGGDITSEASWGWSYIDSLVSGATQYDILTMADFDGDGDDEVAYTGTPRGLGSSDAPQPIVVLNYVSSGIGGTPGVIDGFELSQNYPNPFNPTTSISYTLPIASDVNLTIYNMLGQKVQTIAAGQTAAGTHEAKWNGLNNHGQKVASGIYIYTLRAGNFVQSKKMTLIK